MAGRLRLTRIAMVMAAFAAIALVPSLASAHAGHSHAPAVSNRALHQSEAYGGVVQSEPVAELTAAEPVAPIHQDESGCTERGCCGNGPCTACNGFVQAPESVLVPPTHSTLLTIRDLPPWHSAEARRLRRPPKSLA